MITKKKILKAILSVSVSVITAVIAMAAIWTIPAYFAEKSLNDEKF